ncbi:MAG TPA: sulfotransferase, partial [Acetobacteraceae bacterium]|nr:sulfotransferase [Acetobacteraceae bacterium]
MIRRAFQRLLTPASSPDPLPGPGSLPADQGLFIIGAARSGTTILQNALNDSPEIFLFGEANFHTDPGTPDFAARYNAMHRSWHNQETKSSFCPPVLPRDSYWHDYVRWLASHHRLVGSKTVINPVRPAGWLERLFAFHCQHFYQSSYIFTFRDPVATILSTRDLQVLLSGHTEGLRSIMRNYVDTVLLFVSMLRALPNVRAVCHEDIDRAT